MARRPRKWSYTAGDRPHTVTVYERRPGGPLYIRIWDPTARGGEGNWVRRSLGYRNRTRARSHALEQAAKLAQGKDDLSAGRVALSQIFALYLRYRTPRKAKTSQRSDDRRVRMWTRVFGGDRDPHSIALREWEAFIDRRRSGDLRSDGSRARNPKPVRDRTVEADCNWLRWVFNWAAKWRTEQGTYLMRENPIRGFPVPKEQNPRRPVATADRYEAVRAVTDDIEMEIRWPNVPRSSVRSHLSEIFDIVNGTGRRISAVLQLRYEDLRLNDGPHGAIRWPADTDKMSKETVVPISPAVRRAIDRVIRERPGIGSAYLFPAPGDASEPVSRHLADTWLRKAEQLAGVERQEGSLWHAYRRKWATERKHLPDVDVAAAGGWTSLVALKQSYQQADTDTMLRVVLGAGELRESEGA